MRYTLSILALVALTVTSTAATAASDDVIDHASFSALLNAHVDGEGQVAYGSWHADEEAMAKLDRYVKAIADASVEGHSRDAKLAFYLNAYNALVLDSVLSNWPVASPKKIDGFFEGNTHKVAGEKMTLDHLEHQLIRPEFDEPRIHFVLVCAADSCPRLLQQALTAESLENDLESATREFVAAATRLAATSTDESGDSKQNARKVVTSKLFDWFAQDFRQAKGSVRDYLAAYTSGEVETALEEGAEITFSSYDWSINAQSD